MNHNLLPPLRSLDSKKLSDRYLACADCPSKQLKAVHQIPRPVEAPAFKHGGNPDFSQTRKKAGPKTAKMYVWQVFQQL
ncbi:MAG: hypothetical protein ACYT04_45390 [Nostoc sp.]